MSPNDEQSTQRRRAARWPALLTLGLSAGALSLAWIIWGTGKAPPEPADPHEAILHPAPSSSASSLPGSRASSALAVPLTAPTQALGGTASTHMGPPETSKAPKTPGALGVPQLPSLPNADLATQAHLALQSGTPKEALELASELAMCEHSDLIAAARYKDYQKQGRTDRDQVQLNEALERQRRCQAVDAAAKDLQDPLILRSLEGGLPEASLFIAVKPHLMEKLSPAQKTKVLQEVQTLAAQGDVISIVVLATASPGLGTSARHIQAYNQALIWIRQEPGGFAEVLRQWPEALQESWKQEVERGRQLLSQAELEQVKQEASEMLRNYREASKKDQIRNHP